MHGKVSKSIFIDTTPVIISRENWIDNRKENFIC